MKQKEILYCGPCKKTTDHAHLASPTILRSAVVCLRCGVNKYLVTPQLQKPV